MQMKEAMLQLIEETVANTVDADVNAALNAIKPPYSHYID